MRELPESLKTSLASGCTTLCHCWLLVRMDGLTLGFTDHDRPLTFDDVTYQPVSGFEASEATSTSGFGVSGLEVVGAIDSERLKHEDLAAGLFDNAHVEHYLVDWTKTESRLRLRVGNLGEVVRSDEAFRAEIRGLMHQLDQIQGRRFTRACDAVLGDQRCGVDVNNAIYSAEATIARVIDDLNVEIDGADAYRDGWFSRGRARVTTGENAGQVCAIGLHRREQGRVFLNFWQGALRPWQTGDRLMISAGCDQSFEICRNKFANHLNYRGFPQIPGNDFVYSYASGRDRNDGGSLL